MNLEKVIDQVNKLRALSKSDNANEAASAAAAANRLIDKHRLSEADLSTDNPEAPTEDSSFIYETGRITMWKHDLMLILATHYGCKVLNFAYYPEGRKTSRFKLFGRVSDMAVVHYMFGWLVNECSRLSDSEMKGKGHVAANSYCIGLIHGVQKQLKQSREDMKAEFTSTALVKLDSRLDESNSFMKSIHTNIKTTVTTSKSFIDGGAYSSGQERGKDIRLGKALK